MERWSLVAVDLSGVSECRSMSLRASVGRVSDGNDGPPPGAAQSAQCERENIVQQKRRGCARHSLLVLRLSGHDRLSAALRAGSSRRDTLHLLHELIDECDGSRH